MIGQEREGVNMENIENIENLGSNNIKKSPKFLVPVLVMAIIIIGGVITGYLLSQNKGLSSGGISAGTINKPNEVGSADSQTFKDTATGVLEAGGLNGDGTHKLIREGGPSQTAYLTSSVIDLDQFVGKKVQVWGETQKGQKVSWLMDVGRIKIIE
jgi:hypothetical protein